MISSEYRDILLLEYKKKKWFDAGIQIEKYFLDEIIKENNVKTALDFGGGYGTFANYLQEQYNVDAYCYDPGTCIEEYVEDRVDLVTSIGVLEHVERESIVDTLKWLKQISNHHYHVISCNYANHTLSNGKNAHLIVEAPDWWRDTFVAIGYQPKKHKLYAKYDEKRDQLKVRYWVYLQS